MNLIEIIRKNREWNLNNSKFNILYLSNIKLIPIDQIVVFNSKLMGIDIKFNQGTLNNFIPEIIENSEKNNVTIVDLDLSGVLQDISESEANFEEKIEFLSSHYLSFLNQLELNFPIQNNLIISYLTKLSYSSSVRAPESLDKFINNFNNSIDKLSIQNKIVINKQELIEIVGTSRAIKSELISADPAPYTLEFTKIYGEILSVALSSFLLPYKKLIVLDCDNTLWGGEIGEIDAKQIPKSYLEDSDGNFQEIQKMMKAYQSEGMMLGLASKNEERNVKRMFETNEMELNWKDFANTKINWNPKSKNIENMCLDLNIDPNSVLFIDDSLYEIFEIVHSNLTVSCFVAPKNLLESKLLKVKLDLLLRNRITTSEDLNRQKILKEDENRKNKSTQYKNYDSFLETLNTKLVIKKLQKKDALDRASQISEKTNQFNFMQQRFKIDQLQDLVVNKNIDIFIGNLFDEIGEMGDIILLVAQRDVPSKTIVEIIEFNMSCRVFGRGVAEKFLNEIREYYKNLGIEKILLTAKFNPKNSVFRDFFTNNGFSEIDKKENNVEYECLINKVSSTSTNYISVERLFHNDRQPT